MADHNITGTYQINKTNESIADRKLAATISKSAITRSGFISFTVSCNGETHVVYVLFNGRK